MGVKFTLSYMTASVWSETCTPISTQSQKFIAKGNWKGKDWNNKDYMALGKSREQCLD